MTNGPDSNQQPDAPSPGRPRRRRQLLLGALLVLVLGLGGGMGYAWFFIQRQLAPFVSQTLSKGFDRPVELGKVERVTLNSIRFGETRIPATSTDTDRATAEAVHIKFNPLLVLAQRTLRLQVTLVEPNAYIEQDKDRGWIATRFKPAKKRGPLRIKLRQLNVRDGSMLLVPRSAQGELQSPISIALPQLRTRFGPQLNRIQYRMRALLGEAQDQGKLRVRGQARRKQRRVQAQIAAQGVEVAPLNRLRPSPIDLRGGTVDGDLELTYQRGEPLALQGQAQLNEISGQLAQLSEPFTQVNGPIRFRGSTIQLDSVSAQLGKLGARAEGTVDLESGFDLAIELDPTPIQVLLGLARVEAPPVPLAGIVGADLQVTGPLATPNIAIQARNQGTARVDRFRFESLQANLNLLLERDNPDAPRRATLAIRNLIARPVTGGQLGGEGRIELAPTGGLSLDISARNIASEAITRRYRPDLPLALGPLDATARVSGSLDDLPAVTVTGSAELAAGGGRLVAERFRVSEGRWQSALQALGVRLSSLTALPKRFQSGQLNGRFELAGSLSELRPSAIRGTGSANLLLAGGSIVAQQLQLRQGRWRGQLRAQGVRIERLVPQLSPQPNAPLSGSFTLAGSLTDLSPNALRAQGSARLPIAGGTVRASSLQLRNGRWRATVLADGIRTEQLSDRLPSQLQGPLNGRVALQGSLSELSARGVGGQGSVRLSGIAGGTVRVPDLQFADGRWQATLVASGLRAEQLSDRLPPQAEGRLSGRFNLAGSLTNPSLATISARGSGRLAGIAGGNIQASQVRAGGGNWQANLVADGVRVRQLSDALPPQAEGRLSGRFNLAGSLTNPSLANLSARGSGRLADIAGGTIRADQVRAGDGSWQADLIADGVRVRQLSDALPPQVGGRFNGEFALQGSLANLSPQSISARGLGRLSDVAGGTVRATQARLQNGEFSATLLPDRIQLGRFSQRLDSELSGGTVEIQGNLANLSPSAIQAQGQLQFEQGLAIVDRALRTDFRWGNGRLQIRELAAQGLEASGFADLDLNQRGAALVERFNFEVDADGLNLDRLPLPQSGPAAAVDANGLASFDGTLRGTPTAPTVNGDVALRDFNVNDLSFAPLLEGTLSVSPQQGTQLRLSGDGDRIQLALAPDFHPNSFLVRSQQARIEGERQGDILQVTTQDLPMQLVQTLAPLPPTLEAQSASGKIAGDLDINLETLGASGDLTVTDPFLGGFSGDRLQADFRYRDGTLQLEQGQFRKGESQLQASGRLALAPSGPKFRGEAELVRGRVQDILTALQVFRLSDLQRGAAFPDYAEASELNLSPIDVQGMPLEDQLRRLAEIQALLAQQWAAREDQSRLPPLAEAEGQLSGTATFSGGPQAGIEAQFDVQGQDLDWGPYQAQRAVAQGRFADGQIKLQPARLEGLGQKESAITLVGTLGGESQSAQLQVTELPVSLLRETIELPAGIEVEGNINGQATIAGSPSNPQTRGELTLTEATLNGEALQSVESSFLYSDARLAFSAEGMLREQSEPLVAQGSIPYQLPFATQAPENQQFEVSFDLQDEGLTLVNILTQQQVQWVEGQGQVQLDLAGTFNPQQGGVSNLTTDGSAQLADAVLRAQALPEPLTEVNGQVSFDFNRVNVERLQGQLGGGTVSAQGTLPLNEPEPQQNPLTVTLDGLDLALQEIYNGGVNGRIRLTGTALEPTLGGKVTLADGKVQLQQRGEGEEGSSADSADGAAQGNGAAEGNGAGFRDAITFNDFQVALGEGVRVVRPPLIKFGTSGQLTLNGPLSDLRPQGTIALESGRISLFTTRFRLKDGYPQTATFVPSQGLDPTLDVRLIASVVESSGSSLVSDAQGSEIVGRRKIPTGTVGRFETIDVEATVQGQARRLRENLALSSNPSRSEDEIVTLLGGSFVGGASADRGTLGLAKFAGSALLNRFQNTIGEAIGLDELRLSPTFVPSDERKEGDAVLGLAAEAGIDLSDRLSFSVLKIFNSEQSLQYGLRYRLNENTVLRGATDLSGDNRAAIEYNLRF